MNSESPPRRLILASASSYRKMLLQRLTLAFECHASQTDESAGSDEAPADLASRLAHQKATVVAHKYPAAIVIGADQLAVFDGQIIGKPESHKAAMLQLSAFSGKSFEFITAVTVLCKETGFSERHTDRTRVCFRNLQHEEIERYLLQEKPYDCAGAFKVESLGITLFESVISQDPTALTGLPLIKTAAMLRKAGIPLP